MQERNQKIQMAVLVILSASAAGFIDGFLQPPYFMRAALKAGFFSLIPLIYFLYRDGSLADVKRMLIPKKGDLRLALLLGLGVYGLILGGYLVSTRIYDISDMVISLTGDAGVGTDNFLWVSLYISFVNSFMEEFLFRGFAFVAMKQVSGRKFAYWFSALVFALYHVGMMAAGNMLISLLAVVALVVAGMFFNWLDERSGTIVPSWLVHMFANFAINTVACMIFGII